MITNSGIHIQRIGGAAGTPTIEDIAVQSARICRFGGAVWAPLLPHLVLVGMLAFRRGGGFSTIAWAFLHDAHETVTSDVPRPFKCDCLRTEQRAIDERLLVEFGINPLNIDFELVEQCDRDACDIEAVALGLPRYAEIMAAHSSDYRSVAGVYDGDGELFDGIRDSPFSYEEIIRGREAIGVQHFIDLLTEIRGHETERVRARLQEWEAGFLDLGSRRRTLEVFSRPAEERHETALAA